MLPYPQSADTAKQLIARQGLTLKQWAHDHGQNYQTVRDVLNRDVSPQTGKRLAAAIALGLLPEHPGQPASHDPKQQRLAAANQIWAKLREAGVQIVSMDAEAQPFPFFKIYPCDFARALGPHTNWEIKDGKTVYREQQALFGGCLLIWIEETQP